MQDATHGAEDAEALRAMLDVRLMRDLEALRRATEEQLPSVSETARTLRERMRRRDVARRRILVAGGLAAACSTALAAPLWRDAPLDEAPAQEAARGVPSVGDASPALRPAPTATTAVAATKAARARRDALRSEIARNVLGPPAARDAASRPPESRPAAGSPITARPGSLANKLGAPREKLVAFLNAELTPFLHECVAQAGARAPDLSGMYAIGVETLADEDLGAVIDVVDPAPRNEVPDAQFFECVRESAFTLIIPAPLTSGQEKFEITGYLGAQPASDQAPSKP